MIHTTSPRPDSLSVYFSFRHFVLGKKKQKTLRHRTVCTAYVACPLRSARASQGTVSVGDRIWGEDGRGSRDLRLTAAVSAATGENYISRQNSDGCLISPVRRAASWVEVYTPHALDHPLLSQDSGLILRAMFNTHANLWRVIFDSFSRVQCDAEELRAIWLPYILKQ